jgi:thiol:disulfide interchange protein DsbA
MKHLAPLRTLTLFAGLLLATACTAQSHADASAPYTEGDQYVTLPAPHQRYSNVGKVEVAEVFSYGCIHCAEFSPAADKLKKSLPPGVKFELVPAPFSDEWLPFARAYYAADKLGVVDRTHLELFKEKFVQNYPMNSMDDLADFYARQGVNRDEFMRLANSPEATAKLKADLDLIRTWGVDGTPSIVVDGKYRVANVKTLDELSKVTQWLVQRELDAANKAGK